MKYLFTDRFGGVSNGAYESLNLALHVEDNLQNVTINREILSQKIGTKNLVFMDQIHKDNIEIITDINQKKALQSDAMITNLKDVSLCVMVADCLPILFYDAKKEVIGVAHAGRGGVYLKIANKTIEKMIDKFSCDAEDIKVYVGSSIKSCCYEVKIDVTKGFEKYLHIEDKKIYLNIVQKCVDDMQSIGIKEENIDISPICTSCDKNYFSYRRDGVTGRFCGAITL